VARDGEVGEKRFDLGQTQLARMAQVVEANVARDPVDVALLGADRLVFAAEHIAHVLQQLSRG